MIKQIIFVVFFLITAGCSPMLQRQNDPSNYLKYSIGDIVPLQKQISFYDKPIAVYSSVSNLTWKSKAAQEKYAKQLANIPISQDLNGDKFNLVLVSDLAERRLFISGYIPDEIVKKKGFKGILTFTIASDEKGECQTLVQDLNLIGGEKVVASGSSVFTDVRTLADSLCYLLR